MDQQEAFKRQLLENYLKQQNSSMNFQMQQQQMNQKAAQQYRPSTSGSTISSGGTHTSRPQPERPQQHTQKRVNNDINNGQVGQQIEQRSEPLRTSTGKELVMINPDEALNENITLEEFKEYVKKWFELDNMIKKAQEAIKERKKVRDKLSVLISRFMCKYDIEDLNTKEGRIRCKVKQVKEPVNKKAVIQKITDYFKDDEGKKNEIMTKIYDERNMVEKVSLRRLKIS